MRRTCCICIDVQRAVAVNETAEITAAAGGSEVVQSEARTVDGNAGIVIDAQILPVKVQSILRSRLIGLDDRQQRIVCRAVLDRLDAGPAQSAFQTLLLHQSNLLH